MEVCHRYETLNGLRSHFVIAGEGPTLLFLHGFPDIWKSWEPVMQSCVENGFRVIAPDLRGFGKSEGSRVPGQSTAFDVLGDMIALLAVENCASVGLVGHDWGAEIAWHLALLGPDRFSAIAALSVPYLRRPVLSLPETLRQFGPKDLYLLYFLEEGLAERELDKNPETFLRRIFYANHGKRPAPPPPMRLSANGRLIDALDEPPVNFPYGPFFDLADHVAAFSKAGFGPALDTYRSLHRTWQLTAGWADRTIEVPALFIGGEKDIVLDFPGMREGMAKLNSVLPCCAPLIIFPDTGHFIQIERPAECARALIDFFRSHFPEPGKPGA